MASAHHLRWTLGAAALVVLAGCGGDDGPTAPVAFSDPAATTASIAALDTVFDAPAIQSFGSVAGWVIVPSPTALGPVGDLLGATQVIPKPGEPLSQLGRARLDALRRLRPQLGTMSAAGPIIPDTYYGWVFAWDCASGGYVQQATTGGPATGIRFLLYAVDPFTGQIACPDPSSIGYVDLTDASNTSADRLRVEVVSGGITYIDYTISITDVSLGVAGTIRNGAPAAPGTKTLTFTLSLEVAGAPPDDFSVTASTTFELDRPQVTFAMTEAVAYDAAINVYTITVDLQVSRPGESVQIVYTVVTDGSTFEVTGEVRISGQRFATFSGSLESVTFRDRSGQVIESGPVLEVLTALEDATLSFDYLVFGLLLAPLGGI